MKTLFFALLFGLSTALSTSALAAGEGAPPWKRDAAITLFSAVGGGVLGLSTLSFYGSPQDHTSNITTGVVLGLCAGIGYVFWEHNQTEEAPRWSLQWENKRPSVAYQFTF